MYKIKTTGCGYCIVTVLLLFIAPTVSAGIVGSAHDFSASGWSGGEICVPCHTPHGANTTVADAPLWNHQLSGSTYTLYTSPTLDLPTQQPRGPTKLCLSCHDGTVAIDNFGGNTGGTTYIEGNANLGTDLSNDHPVSIEWRHQDLITSGDFCMNCHFGEPREVIFFQEAGGGPIWIECASCHDVHNGTNYEKLLRKPLANSELCLTCHEK